MFSVPHQLARTGVGISKNTMNIKYVLILVHISVKSN